jgi:hypothetical protein
VSKKTKRETTHQHITLIRVVSRVIGDKVYHFWHGGGQVFAGRACHMYALRAARLSATVLKGQP